MKIARPRVLLLGNGINRAFDSDSWDDLLNSIDCRADKYDIGEFRCPETLKAVLVTEDNVDSALSGKKEALADLGSQKPEKQLELLRRLLAMNFDHILTTNYSYELETAALGKDGISENTLKRIQRHTSEVKRCEASFMLHTFNETRFRGGTQKIWHIHGEARKPDSMVLGHYYYGLLMGKMLELNKKRRNSYSSRDFEILSWTDAFILGDVYILGYGFGFAESDMWWLLNRKKRETAQVGKTVFYELNMPGKSNFAKLDLLRIMNTEIVSMTVENGNWKAMYERAIDDIEKKMKNSRRR